MALKHFKHKDSPFNMHRLRILARPGEDVIIEAHATNGVVVEVQLDTMEVYRMLEFIKQNY